MHVRISTNRVRLRSTTEDKEGFFAAKLALIVPALRDSPNNIAKHTFCPFNVNLKLLLVKFLMLQLL